MDSIVVHKMKKVCFIDHFMLVICCTFHLMININDTIIRMCCIQ